MPHPALQWLTTNSTGDRNVEIWKALPQSILWYINGARMRISFGEVKEQACSLTLLLAWESGAKEIAEDA
eukprot:11343511-Karenia_brevis.AAC.1